MRVIKRFELQASLSFSKDSRERLAIRFIVDSISRQRRARKFREEQTKAFATLMGIRPADIGKRRDTQTGCVDDAGTLSRHADRRNESGR
jgi:hypothetical protein